MGKTLSFYRLLSFHHVLSVFFFSSFFLKRVMPMATNRCLKIAIAIAIKSNFILYMLSGFTRNIYSVSSKLHMCSISDFHTNPKCVILEVLYDMKPFKYTLSDLYYFSAKICKMCIMILPFFLFFFVFL